MSCSKGVMPEDSTRFTTSELFSFLAFATAGHGLPAAQAWLPPESEWCMLCHIWCIISCNVIHACMIRYVFLWFHSYSIIWYCFFCAHLQWQLEEIAGNISGTGRHPKTNCVRGIATVKFGSFWKDGTDCHQGHHLTCQFASWTKVNLVDALDPFGVKQLRCGHVFGRYRCAEWPRCGAEYHRCLAVDPVLSYSDRSIEPNAFTSAPAVLVYLHLLNRWHTGIRPIYYADDTVSK